MTHTNPPRQRRVTTTIVLAAIGVALLLFMVLAEFIAPYTLDQSYSREAFMSPLPVSVLDRTPSGVRLWPHIDGLPIRGRDPLTMRLTTVGKSEEKVYLGFFVDGAPYRLLDTVEGERHLFGPVDETQPAYLLGTDRMGRDLLSLYIYSARNSLDLWLGIAVLTVGLATLLGGLLGRYGGGLNRWARRALDLLRRCPTIVFRGLFFVLILWWWPFVKILLWVVQGRLDSVSPTASMVWLLLLIAGSMGLLALLLHRRLLIWLLVVWTGLHFLDPIRLLSHAMRWLDGSAEGALRAARFPMLINTGVESTAVLVLMMAGPLLIALSLVAYVAYVRRQSAMEDSEVGTPHTAPSVLQLLVPVAVYALAAMPLLILPEVNFFRYGMRVGPAGHFMLGRVFMDLSNLRGWVETPWTLSILLVPILIFVLFELALNTLFGEQRLRAWRGGRQAEPIQ